MPALKPSQACTVVALGASAIGGVSLGAELSMSHPTAAALWGVGCAMVATAANAVAPYLASIGD